MDLLCAIAKGTVNLAELKQLKNVGGNLEIIKAEKVGKSKDEDFSYNTDWTDGYSQTIQS